MIVCMPSVLIAMTLTNIQDIMKYFSSIFGFLLMLVIPNILVQAYRNKFEKTKQSPGGFNRSFVRNFWVMRMLEVIAVVVLGFIIYGFFNKSAKTCVAESD
jgi:hypothetical protein